MPLLDWAGRHGTLILPVGVAIGLAFQPLAWLMRPLLAPSIFLMLVVLFIRLDFVEAFERLRRPALLAASVVLAMVVIPSLTAGLLVLFPQSPGLALAFVLYTASPPNFAAAALAFMIGLDGALAVAMVLTGLALHPVLTPAFVEVFTGGAISIPAGELALRLALLIGGAALLAGACRLALGRARRARAGPALDGLNLVLLLVFAVALMAGIPAQIAERPKYALALVAVVFGLHLALNAVTAAIFWRCGTTPAATVGFCSGGRNIAPAMAVLGPAAPADTWLFFAVLQFPIYLLPMLLKPLYRRLTHRGRSN